MAILLPRKPTLICMAVLGPVCVVDGIVKNDTKEILAMLAVFIFAIVTTILFRPFRTYLMTLYQGDLDDLEKNT